MMSWWALSKNVNGGQRMSTVQSIEESIVALEATKDEFQKASDVSRQSSDEVEERLERADQDEQSFLKDLETATALVQGTSTTVSSETERGTKARDDALRRVGSKTDFDYEPVLERLRLADAKKASAARRDKKDKIESLLRPNTTKRSFDERWGNALRSCARPKKVDQTVASALAEDRRRMLTPGWSVPPEASAVSKETASTMADLQSRLEALNPERVDAADVTAVQKMAAKVPESSAGSKTLFGLLPLERINRSASGPPMCLADVQGANPRASECDDTDASQLWAQMSSGDLVGYAFGSRLKQVQNGPDGRIASSGRDLGLAFRAPTLTPQRLPDTVVFRWHAGAAPVEGTMVLRRGDGRRSFGKGEIVASDTLCLGVAAAPCTWTVTYVGTVNTVVATTTNDPSKWQEVDESSSTWSRPLATPAPGKVTMRVVAAPDATPTVQLNGKLQTQRMSKEVQTNEARQWSLTGAAKILSVELRSGVPTQ